MKNLIYIAAIFWLMSCSKDDPGPKYKDLSGTWTFESENVSGEFVVAKEPNGQYVQIKSGNFTIDGYDFTVSEVTNILTNNETLTIEELVVSKPSYAFILFNSATFKSDFSEMDAAGFDYRYNIPATPDYVEGTKSISVTLTRK